MGKYTFRFAMKRFLIRRQTISAMKREIYLNERHLESGALRKSMSFVV